MDTKDIEGFVHEQIAAWNTGDKDAFFNAYRRVAPKGFTIEYVGKMTGDGWPILENMWNQQQAKFEVEEAVCIPCGNEVACHNLNKLRDGSMVLHTIETYRVEQGQLFVRYFIKQPG